MTFSTISAPSVPPTTTLCRLAFSLRTPPAGPTPVLLGLRSTVRPLSSVAVGPCIVAEDGKLVVPSVEDKFEAYVECCWKPPKRRKATRTSGKGSGIIYWRGMSCVELDAALSRAGLMKPRLEVLVGLS